MAKTSGRVTAAPAILKFKDGTTYEFSPLTDRDMEELDEWLAARVVENARNSLTPGMTPQEREETLSIAMRVSLEITFLSKTGAKMLSSLDGMVRLCYQSVRKRHPNVTPSQLREQLMKPENLEEINRLFEKVNAVPPPSPKNSPRARRRRVR